jgi:hypothetical protein
MERLTFASIDITLSPEASTHLKKLACMLDPNFVEFAFFGLGKNDFIDTILTADEKYFRSGSGAKLNENGHISSSVNPEELVNLYTRLFNSDRSQDFLVFGHYHPNFFAKTREILNLSKSDISTIKLSTKNSPRLIPPYSAILSKILDVPVLQIYKNSDVVKLRNAAGIGRLQKVTIKL